MLRALIAGLLPAFLIACTAPIQHEGPREAGLEHVLTKNYKVGVPKTVNVGEPMVKVIDYWNQMIEEPTASPSQSVSLKGGPVNLRFNAGRSYPIRGRIPHDGKTFLVVPNTEDPVYQAALVSEDGTILDRVVARMPNGNHVMVIYTMTIDPPAAKLVRQRSTRVASSHSFINYELIYTGLNSSGLNLTYREFSPEGLARVAFFQNLTYPADAKSITFRQMRIAIEKASAENVTFSVTQDGEH
ncbi:hypothetical protein M2165_001660 [Variovorax sp. TBS-050B]|uniref:hypothetical protein n=1 Tax=Variovorax sp. TBS-050B TaxID=2940551 RepID=UPI0024758497|nr:hypothetical protein [Variovorax sp. TBS-050B]MDH6591771.1 hypothetical protein [Variovorax sp. TBS-050B]